MEKIRELRAQIETWLGQLSQRERAILALTGAALGLFILFLVSLSVSSAIDTREARIDAKTRALAQVGNLTAGYRQAQAERLSLEARLKSQQISLMSFISQASARVGVEANQLRPMGPGASPSSGVLEESVQLTVNDLEIGKLAKLIEELEMSPMIFVKVREIKLQSRTDNPALVNVTLVVATYQLKS